VGRWRGSGFDDADVSIALPKIPYGEFSPVRLQGQPVRSRLRAQPRGQACSRHTRVTLQFASTLRTLPPRHRTPGTVSRQIRASACRCARGLASLPQGSLAPVRVMLSRSIIAYYDPIRQSRRHAAISRFAAYTPRLRCAGAPRRPTRPSLLSLLCSPHVPSTLRRWVRATLPLCWCRGARLPRDYSESPPTSPRLCQQSPTGLKISALHRSRHAAARTFALPSGLAPTSMPPYARHRAF